MNHAQYQHRITQKFALIRLRQFAEGDPVSTTPSDCWFLRSCTLEQAIAALPEQFISRVSRVLRCARMAGLGTAGDERSKSPRFPRRCSTG
jgi:hypothetical protein